SALKIRKIKKEQAEKQKMPKYTIKSTDKEELKDYDLKSALYQTMHENKSFNRTPANHALYHVLIEDLIKDENAMDKGVSDTVKNHKRQHDDWKRISHKGQKEGQKQTKPSTEGKRQSQIKAESKNTKKGNAMYYPRFTKLIVNFVMAKDPSIPRRNKVNWHYARDDPMFTTINKVKKKADFDATTKKKPPTVPKEKKGKKTGKGKQKAKEIETISEAILTEAEQLKIITKRSRVLDAPDYDSDDDISWKSSEDDQDEIKMKMMRTFSG
ncbi:hypothetical protein Tco_0156233, partial [Tanacetum coccineum]